MKTRIRHLQARRRAEPLRAIRAAAANTACRGPVALNAALAAGGVPAIRSPTPPGRSKHRRNCRMSAPCPFAGVRRSLSPRYRNRTGKPTIHRRHTARWSAGRKLRRSSAQASPVATATRAAAHGSRNHALHRSPPPSRQQSPGARTGIARAIPARRNIEARRDPQRSDQPHRDVAEKAIEAAAGGGAGGGYVCSREVSGVAASYCQA